MIRVGPAGWSYADWQGSVYPRRRPRGFRPLVHLARSFSCIEVNSSFYAVPDAEHTARWVEDVEPFEGFRFTAKLQGRFTHDPFDPTSEGIAARERAARRWLEGIEPLRASGRLAAVLVQFPASFCDAPRSRERLEELGARFGHLRPVLEVRHASWFETDALRFVDGLGFSVAHIDLPPAPDHPPMSFPVTGPVGYVRLHGRNASAWFDRNAGRDQRYDYLYRPEELEDVLKRTRRLSGEVDETYVITNNHFSGKAVANALEILAALEDPPPIAPAELVSAFPRLRGRVRLFGQQGLFD